MIAGHEPRLHALSVVPRTARSGDVVCITFRVRNHGCRPTAPGDVRFVLSSELEPLAQTELPLESVEVGGELCAHLRARVATALTDRTELRAHAILTSAGEHYATNVCTVLVRTFARFDDDRSGTSVERIDRDHVRVRAWAVNAGDGPAIDTLLTLPTPPGCARIDGDGPIRVTIERLAPGERIDAALDARIIEPGATVCADTATIGWHQAEPIAVRAATALALAAELDAPNVHVVPGSARAAVRVELRNSGWADADDVPVTIGLPDGLRLLAGSLTVDGVAISLRAPRLSTGALASARRDESSLAIVLARVPAQSTAHLAFDVACPIDGTPCELTVQTDAHRASTVIAAPAHVDVRLRLIDMPRWIEAGGCLSFGVEIVNGGPLAQRIAIAIAIAADVAANHDSVMDMAVAAQNVRPGTRGIVRLRAPVADFPCVDGRLTGHVVARAGDLEIARLPFAVAVRDDARLMIEGEPTIAPGGLTYVVRNVGTTTARGLSLAADDRVVEVAPIAAGAHVGIVLPADASHRSEKRESHSRTIRGLQPGEVCGSQAGEIRNERGVALRLPALRHSNDANIDLELELASRAVSGTTVRVRLSVTTERDVDQLSLVSNDLGGCIYVPGSATIDDRCLAEPNDGTPVIDGLRIFGIPARTTLTIEWSLVALQRPDEAPVELRVAVDADGRCFEAHHDGMLVEDRAAFAMAFPTHGYFVDAIQAAAALIPPTTSFAESTLADTNAARIDVEAADHSVDSVDAEVCSSVLALRAAWADDTRRLLGRSDEDGLLTHIFVVRALFPDVAIGGEPELTAVLAAARSALRDVFDRLFVKIRIPGFPVEADDVEDLALRSALIALFETLGAARGLPAAKPRARIDADARGRIYANIDAHTARTASATLTSAGLGTPAMLRTLVALLPIQSDDDSLLADVLARYVVGLDLVLAQFVDAPLAAFDEALTTGRYPDVDAARRSLIAALDERGARTVGW